MTAVCLELAGDVERAGTHDLSCDRNDLRGIGILPVIALNPSRRANEKNDRLEAYPTMRGSMVQRLLQDYFDRRKGRQPEVEPGTFETCRHAPTGDCATVVQSGAGGPPKGGTPTMSRQE